jgi:hypothetical protein
LYIVPTSEKNKFSPLPRKLREQYTLCFENYSKYMNIFWCKTKIIYVPIRTRKTSRMYLNTRAPYRVRKNYAFILENQMTPISFTLKIKV